MWDGKGMKAPVTREMCTVMAVMVLDGPSYSMGSAFKYGWDIIF